MPDFWEYPTVSMGLGPINAIAQAHLARYLHARGLADTSPSRVWAFVGDGEFDEPETLALLGMAGREHLDNLTMVVNCNLQRLDGPVRGNGKVIQEFEATLRGAGWNVIKVVWGRTWDDLLARDVDGVLLAKMNETVDGEFQKYATESGAYIREHFFGPDPRLPALVEHLSDAELQSLPRGGHDYRKLYAAYRAATEHTGAPTAILAKTVKGWTLGPEIEARNATHQIKKMTKEQLRTLRDRLFLHEEIAEADLDEDLPPYYRPAPGSAAGRVPGRAAPGPRRPPPPPGGPGTAAARTRPRRLRRPARRLRPSGGVDHHGVRPAAPVADPRPGRRPSDRAHRVRRGPHLRPRVAHQRGPDLRAGRPALHPGRRRPGPPLRRECHGPGPRGGDHRGRGDGHLHRRRHLVRHLGRGAHPLLPLLFDVRLPAGGRPAVGTRGQPRPWLPPRLHRRAHHAQRRGPPAPGRALAPPGLRLSVGPGLRPGVRPRGGDHRGGRHPADDRSRARGPLLVPDPLQRELRHAGRCPRTRRRPSGIRSGTVQGMYRFADTPSEVPGSAPRATLLLLGDGLAGRHGGPADCWPRTGASGPRPGRSPPTRRSARRPSRPTATTASTPTPTTGFPWSPRSLAGSDGPIVAVTDFMRAVPDQVARWMPRRFTSLGTDGFGRSDTREVLRRFFEVDAAHVVVATLEGLVADGTVPAGTVAAAVVPLRHRRRRAGPLVGLSRTAGSVSRPHSCWSPRATTWPRTRPRPSSGRCPGTNSARRTSRR